MKPENVDPKRRPETWLENKIESGAGQVQSYLDEFKRSTSAHPLATVAAAFGVGYVARSLPLFRLGGAAIRSSLHLLPYALLVVGGARAYEVIRTRQDRGGARWPGKDGPAS